MVYEKPEIFTLDGRLLIEALGPAVALVSGNPAPGGTFFPKLTPRERN